MGLEDREWYREEKRRGDRPRHLAGALVVVAVIAGLVAAAGARGGAPTCRSSSRRM